MSARRITIIFLPSFIKSFQELETSLQERVAQRVRLFETRANHQRLAVHKLKGKLHGRYSFSVNQKYRIVFQWADSKTAVFLAIGDHDVYQ